ncbi:hypothetical protein AVEN_242731-1 [Araneus ventricosus]|uniref:Uncharacterized protein n=1 Tax=Araneus ventricosus TaxID=182803 RepID=A0A4Y2L0J1_ARAVE|nr:hypothetical protein AVEN_242731-1 [Araneus ventricosus]
MPERGTPAARSFVKNERGAIDGHLRLELSALDKVLFDNLMIRESGPRKAICQMGKRGCRINQSRSYECLSSGVLIQTRKGSVSLPLGAPRGSVSGADARVADLHWLSLPLFLVLILMSSL